MDVQTAVNLMQQGLQHKRNGKYEESLKCYLVVVYWIKSEPEPYKNLGKIYYILGQYQNSINCYKKCINLMGTMDIDNLRHMGHAICDPLAASVEEKAIVENYRCSIDPYFGQFGSKKYGHVTIAPDTQEEYNRLCMNKAASLLG
ncbi:hypothetical protein P40081_14980 [Paenibacillus sp. FSL P4-0081]|jgi:tetratricopeptide (TPR) repeat protein|uniref:tetratricopeptide repeat protein n=1 Tax=unclassified Paenibacillus TaxID=185978 RepID=UPI0004F758B8|nr:tetratricopeptide repeat protein [Paenibacillus sp. FSL P4-0081]AIQ29310.1 hypothetical protein P40081_14980 [Paenibacillus sp. FSL P4-0081]